MDTSRTNAKQNNLLLDGGQHGMNETVIRGPLNFGKKFGILFQEQFVNRNLHSMRNSSQDKGSVFSFCKEMAIKYSSFHE